MKIRMLLLPLICVSAFMFSCQKETDNIIKTTQQKIEGKWNIDSVIINQRISGSTNYENYKGKSDEYIQFNTDGTMRTYLKGNTSVSNYKVRNDTAITIDGDTGYIQDLTDQKFKLFTRADAGSIGFIEITYFLGK